MTALGMTAMATAAPQRLTGARLPRWSLPAGWPVAGAEPVLAELRLAAGRITDVRPWAGGAPAQAVDDTTWHLGGAPVLPGLVDAHTHIDKAFTLSRLGQLKPGLLAAIEAMSALRLTFTADDIRTRATRSLQWAFDAGVVKLRTHCDWWEPTAAPLAWGVLRDLAAEWADRVVLERVSLIPLGLFAERDAAWTLARLVAAGGPGACLGAFVHSTNWNPVALRQVFEAAEAFGLDVDLHCDEELNPDAVGLAHTAALLRDMAFGGRVVCGHTCALAAQPPMQALATLDAVARAPITLVSLPATNLLLQDAVTGRTPRQRGLTLVKEARERGIPLLLASDNVQDAFCRSGSGDPVEALAVGALAAQLEQPFDEWSEAICRGDWLARTPGAACASPWQPGAPADLVVFPATDAWGFPTRTQPRVVLRGGRLAAGSVPPAWQATVEAA